MHQFLNILDGLFNFFRRFSDLHGLNFLAFFNGFFDLRRFNFHWLLLRGLFGLFLRCPNLLLRAFLWLFLRHLLSWFSVSADITEPYEIIILKSALITIPSADLPLRQTFLLFHLLFFLRFVNLECNSFVEFSGLPAHQTDPATFTIFKRTGVAEPSSFGIFLTFFSYLRFSVFDSFLVANSANVIGQRVGESTGLAAPGFGYQGFFFLFLLEIFHNLDFVDFRDYSRI